MATNTACSIKLPQLSATTHRPFSAFINPNSNQTLLHFSRCCRLKRATFKGLVFCSAAKSEFEPNDLDKSTSINLKLPRRRMLVHFTCNACGERTQRLINRLAYERGLVYVQCAGCLRHHKLADNLGMVVEYNLRDDASLDHNTESG